MQQAVVPFIRKAPRIVGRFIGSLVLLIIILIFVWAAIIRPSDPEVTEEPTEQDQIQQTSTESDKPA